MSKIREKESLECVRMHIWASKTQKLPGPLSGPWTPAAECSLRSRDSALLRRQLSASEAGDPPLTKSWIRTCVDMYIWHDLPHVWIHCEESGFKQNIWNTYFINIGAPMNYHWPYFWIRKRHRAQKSQDCKHYRNTQEWDSQYSQ